MPPGYSDIHAVVREQPRTSPFDGILEKSRDFMCERLDFAIGDMLDKADEVLTELIRDTQNRDERCLYEEAREVATKQRDTIEQHFRRLYLEDFKRRSESARKIERPLDQRDYTLDTLTLVADEDLEETLKFNDMATKLRAYCDDELVALDQRVGVLLGDAGLQAKDNPFAPQVICDAFKLACRELDAEPNVRRVLLRLFDDHVLDDIRSIYKAVNALLVRHSILPKIRYSISRSQQRQGAAAGPSSQVLPVEGVAQDAPGVTLSNIAPQELYAILQNLVVNNAGTAGPGGAPGTTGATGAAPAAGGGAPVLQGPELMSLLTRIQLGDPGAPALAAVAAPGAVPGAVNVLHDLRGSSVGAGMGPMDLMTLDIIAMLFDQLFDDPKVPNGVKGLIGRLQIPMLKVAIADKSFFSTKTHPARRLLDTLGEIALRLPADFGSDSPLFARLQAILQELVDGFQDNVEIFTAVRGQLDTLMAEEDQRIEQDAKAAARQVEELENLALAKSVAQEEVKARVESRLLPPAVRAFLTQQWLKLLLLVHAKEGRGSAAWKDAVEVMDQLLWSIEPKNTSEERRKLAALVPGLVKQITTGLRNAGIDDEVRVQFFGELMTLHTQAIGVSAQSKAAAAPADTSASAAQAPAAPPAMIDGGAVIHDPTSLDFSQPIVVKNPYGEGDVSVDSKDLDFTAEAEKGARAKREASIDRALDALKTGTWWEFRDAGEHGATRAARLIFVSPRKTRFLFAVDRAGREIIQCSRAEIGRRLRSGEAIRLDEPPQESLFDRIMNGLLGKLRGPGRAVLFPT